jgi:hypothetical protein
MAASRGNGAKPAQTGTRDMRGLLLAPQAAEDYDFFGLRGRPQRMPKGRGFVCGEGAKHLVQAAHAE